jgi:hypothetical protein
VDPHPQGRKTGRPAGAGATKYETVINLKTARRSNRHDVGARRADPVIRKRREFIRAGGAAMARPLAARARQSAKQHRIGMLETISPELNVAHLDASTTACGNSVTTKDRVIPSSIAQPTVCRPVPGWLPSWSGRVDLIVARGAGRHKPESAETIHVMASVGDPLLVVDSLALSGPT